MAWAGETLGRISIEYPRDLLALAVGHQIDFFTGDAVSLRDRIGRALGGWPADDPQLGFVHGMYAFGLEESNQYQQSEEFGQAAVERNPDDVWGIHAVVHTYEMAGRVPDGVRFMRSREADWQTGNFLNVHNSWHYALYLLQGGDTDGALATYDRIIHHADSQDSALELLDASALLWRMYLEGTPVGERWAPLAAAWARILAPGFYPFNDMHAVMSFIGNGELDRAEDLVRTLDEIVSHPVQGSTGWLMTSMVGAHVCQGLVHFGRGEYDRAIARLLPGRTRVHTVRRQPRSAGRRRAHAARGRDQGRADGARGGAGQRAAVDAGVQLLRVVQAGLAAERGRATRRAPHRPWPGPGSWRGRSRPRRADLPGAP